jgi:hypothetical protein
MQTPAGPVTFNNTMELEPTPDGTIVHMRFAPPDTEREVAILTQMQPMFEGMFAADRASLRALLDGKVAERAARGSEPTLPCPRPDGDFADLPPAVATA